MLAARITLPHFSVSSTMNLPKSTIVIDFGRYIVYDVEKWAKVVKFSGAKAD